MPGNPAWKRRPPQPPFTPAEDAELCQMIRCGLSCDYFKAALPGRTLGAILDRRLTLIETGAATPAAPL